MYRGTAPTMSGMTDKITTADGDNELATACPEPWFGAARYRFGRTIGPWGTAARTVAAAGSLAWALAVPHEHPPGHLPGTGVLWWNVLLGLLIVPGVATVALRLRGRGAAPLLAGHGAQCLAVIAFFAVAQVLPVAMLVALGASLVVQVLRGDDGCEFLAIPNWLLRRNDRLFCLLFTPIDAFEARARRAA